ncbi:MAG: polymorphic toxin type 6 domain-containing protein [Prochloraceae cyanobacterium]|nr:polymorphic toxin type 6 domain-containing protein [Prochloraceae cyanobacterium]
MTETTQIQSPSQTARPSHANGQDIVGQLRFDLHDDRGFGRRWLGNLGSEGKYSGSVTMSATLGQTMTVMGAPRITPDFESGNGSHVRTVTQVHNDGTKPEAMGEYQKYVYQAKVWYINEKTNTTPERQVTEEHSISGNAGLQSSNGSGNSRSGGNNRNRRNSEGSRQRLRSLTENPNSLSGQAILAYLQEQGASVEDLAHSFDQNGASINEFLNQLQQQETALKAQYGQPAVQQASVAAVPAAAPAVPAFAALLKKALPILLGAVGNFIMTNFKIDANISGSSKRNVSYTEPEASTTDTFYHNFGFKAPSF